MTSAIQPSETTIFLQEILLRPFTEGAERINRAINGKNFHDIYLREISLKDRCWSLLVGLSLMIPIINTILWVCMKTFGNPELLSDPFTLAPLRVPPMEPIEEEEEIEEEREEVSPAQPMYAEPLKSDVVKYRDVRYGKMHDVELTVETHKDVHLAKRTIDGVPSMEASFDPDWNLKTCSWKNPPSSDISTERQQNTLYISGSHGGNKVNKECKFPNKPYPWIQQPYAGLRNFILSKRTRLSFYAVHPLELTIVECEARKEQVQLEPYGTVIKVDSYLEEATTILERIARIAGPIHFCSAWFHPESCDLLKCDYLVEAPSTWCNSNIVKD